MLFSNRSIISAGVAGYPRPYCGFMMTDFWSNLAVKIPKGYPTPDTTCDEPGPTRLLVNLPPPGTLVRMHRAYLVRLAEIYGHLIGILHSFRARSRFTTMDAQTSFLQLKLQSREVTLNQSTAQHHRYSN